MDETLTLVIVSNKDFQAHRNANELINIDSYPIWRKSHHECTLSLNRNHDASQQFQTVHPLIPGAKLNYKGCFRPCEKELCFLSIGLR